MSPYPDSFLHDLASLTGLSSKIQLLFSHFIDNSTNFINPFSENGLQVAERYFVLITLFYCLYKSKLFQNGFKKINNEYFIVFLILFLNLLITVGAYDVFDWRDFRVMSPVLMGGLVYLMLENKNHDNVVIISVNLVFILLLIISNDVFSSFHKDRYNPKQTIELLAGIKYNQSINRFGNTLIVTNPDKEIVMSIPAGIGISVAETISDSLQSNYLFTQKEQKLSSYKLAGTCSEGYLYAKISQ